MLKHIFGSIILSVVSILLIFAFPGYVTVQGEKIGPSPYYDEILEVSKKAEKGLPLDAPEWKKLSDLRTKNNAWFESVERNDFDLNQFGVRDFLRIKSERAAFFLAIIWVGWFWFLFGKSYFFVFHLAFPLVSLYMCGVAVIALAAILCAALIVFFLRVWLAYRRKACVPEVSQSSSSEKN